MLTDEQLHTLRHMLGINTPNDKEPKPYRNRYAANPGNEKMAELERLGMVRKRLSAADGYPYDFFEATGVGWVRAMESHQTIRRAKRERVYSRFLSVRDAIPDLTFRQFLTDPEFNDCRRSA